MNILRTVGPSWSPQARRSSLLPWYLHLRCQAVALEHRGMTGSLTELGHRQGQQELLLNAGGLREADFSDAPWDLLFSAFLLTVPGCLRANAHNGNPTRELWEFLWRSSFSNFPALSHPPTPGRSVPSLPFCPPQLCSSLPGLECTALWRPKAPRTKERG